MKVILRKTIATLGNMGDLVDVKPGYARNFLIPNNAAYFATESAIRSLNEERKQEGRKQNKAEIAATKLARELESLSVTIPMQVGEEEKLFGAVTSQMISDALKLHGVDIDRRIIQLEDPIKSLGFYDVPIKLHTNVVAIVKVWVVSQ